MRAKVSLALAALQLLLLSPPASAAEADGPPRVGRAGPPFGELPLVDEVDCGEPGDEQTFKEDPAGASRVEEVLGRKCRVLPTAGGAKYFAYCIGRGKGLVPGAAYCLAIEYPEDRSRSMFVGNRGAEIILGFGTGQTVGDVLKGRYVNHNPESLRLPLSGRYETWKTMFYLHDRFSGIDQPRGGKVRPNGPADGFWVVVGQSKGTNHPMSAGAAVSRVRLFAVPDPGKFDLALRFPPEGLPRRHLFWREEMSDGVVGSPDEADRGVKNPVDWYEYKARLMKFWGMNTFCKDLLEFGHNQGWDSAIHGGNSWVYQSKQPQLWRNVLDMVSRYGFDVLPYYEYAGSIGHTKKSLGKQKRCVTLSGGRTYTHINWSEKANADITDPDTLADFEKILEATVVRHKDKVDFLGVWLRPRPSAIPISFSDRCLGLFAGQANGGRAVTRRKLKGDTRLLEKYYAWWFGKRRDFLLAVRDYLRSKDVGGRGGEDAVVLYTTDTSEPGIGIQGGGVVTDDVAAWSKVPGVKRVVSFEDVTAKDLYLKALLSPRGTWGEWEWQHSCPRNAPEDHRATEGALLTYSFNRAYTVSSARAFDAFRTPSGLAIVRHYALNENEMEKKLGYFVSDVERAGPYCMLGEARAVAYGDPRYIGYLASNCFNRGFPQHVRRFNAAFLALPALPSEVVADACAEPGVVVRMIPAELHGTYFAVVNVGLRPVEATVRLPASGPVSDAATGERVARGNTASLSLGPCELRALHVGGRGAPAAPGGRSGDKSGSSVATTFEGAKTLFVSGDIDGARELFRGIVNDHPSSPYASKAKEYLRILE